MTRPMPSASSIATRKPSSTDLLAFFIRNPLPCTTANPQPISGVMSGATSIAPMTTAVEFCISPSVAIAVDKQISAMKSAFHWLAFCTRSTSETRSSRSSCGMPRLKSWRMRSAVAVMSGLGWRTTPIVRPVSSLSTSLGIIENSALRACHWFAAPMRTNSYDPCSTTRDKPLRKSLAISTIGRTLCSRGLSPTARLIALSSTRRPTNSASGPTYGSMYRASTPAGPASSMAHVGSGRCVILLASLSASVACGPPAVGTKMRWQRSAVVSCPSRSSSTMHAASRNSFTGSASSSPFAFACLARTSSLAPCSSIAASSASPTASPLTLTGTICTCGERSGSWSGCSSDSTWAAAIRA